VLTAYFIVAIVLFFLLYWKWSVNSKANILTKILFLIMTVWGLVCALLSLGILRR